MLQREIDAAIAQGRSLDYIDHSIIDPCRLSAHARLALWVYAHSRVPATTRAPAAATRLH